MIHSLSAEFKYYDQDVVISDSEGVTFTDPETKTWMEMQFEINCGDVTRSPAGEIGHSIEELRIKVEYIDDDIVY